MKKSVYLIIILFVLVLFGDSVYAESSKSLNLDNYSYNNKEDTGLFMSISEFNELYGQPNSESILTQNKKT